MSEETSKEENTSPSEETPGEEITPPLEEIPEEEITPSQGELSEEEKSLRGADCTRGITETSGDFRRI